MIAALMMVVAAPCTEYVALSFEEDTPDTRLRMYSKPGLCFYYDWWELYQNDERVFPILPAGVPGSPDIRPGSGSKCPLRVCRAHRSRPGHENLLFLRSHRLLPRWKRSPLPRLREV